MNWKLIIQLSLFGLAMAVGTVFWIPGNIESFFWLPIFLICAYLIVKNTTGKYFMHGFYLGLANCVWVTSAHIIFYETYIGNHPDEAAMTAKMPEFLATHPQVAMAVMGPIIGIISGLVLGLFAFIAGKLMKK